MALLQATGDTELEMTLERPKGVAGANGSNLVVALTAEDAEIVKRKAVTFLTTEASAFVPSVPSDVELRRLMGLLRNEELDDALFLYGKDALAFDEFPRAAGSPDTMSVVPEGFHVAVIGAGVSGTVAAIQLKRLGIPFTVFERQSAIGGTWERNTYPDARVDTTNFMYQYSFEKNYPWTEYFARQGEVKNYVRYIAEKYGVAGDIQFDTDVEKAVFDESTSTWSLTVTSGASVREFTANAIISAAGLFGVARRLEVPGVDDFEGTIVHTTEWLGDLDLAGKRVAVIGNGSTGVQLLGSIAEQAAHVDVLQRTPQWIAPRARYGDPISEETHWLLNTMPYYWNWYIYSMLAEGLGNQALQEPDPQWQAHGGLINEANDNLRATMTKYIEDQLAGHPDLIAKVTPKHAPMARRLIVDNHWYESLLRDNVELITSPIEKMTSNGYVTADGVEHRVDVVVSATGFATTKFLFPAEYVGADGRSLADVWATDGPRAHLGMTVPGFPNLFIMYGPSAQPRSGSTISIIEQWASYAVKSIVTMLERGARRMEVTEETFSAYNKALDAAAEKLIWVDSGSIQRNYYVNEFGRSQVNEPWPIQEYYVMIHGPKAEHFEFR
ncbi:MAG: hypothetical protein JWQ19_2982 [Subtercola sp.]|nr:hypothetical protein [Subtercola sp.]